MNILIVRLGALGDVIHTVPAVSALRRAFPEARIDWLVDAKHADMVDLVTVLDRVVALERATLRDWVDVTRQLRQGRYDAAIDFQGLMKSAVLARASGAPKVIGLSIWHLREKAARPFYSTTGADSGPEPQLHVIHKNLRLLRTLGVEDDRVVFPLADAGSPALSIVENDLAGAPFALINPGAAWPNKQWPPDRFGEVAAFVGEVRGLTPIVLWGPGEAPLAQAVVDASSGAARLAPPTGLRDLLALSRSARLMVSGDTGPLHIAAAVGTPVVAVFGPTDPDRNGPWSAEDVTVSRYAQCGCHYDRRCHRPAWCLEDVQVPEVTAAIQQRLAHA
jgi:lipopolysaccharide heptosyltransferase I